jgi:glutaredoxin
MAGTKKSNQLNKKLIIITLIIGVLIGAGTMFLINEKIIKNEIGVQVEQEAPVKQEPPIEQEAPIEQEVPVEQEPQNIISKQEAREKISNFIEEQLPPNIIASIVDIVSERGLYKITIDIQGEEIITYLTKDGTLFFPRAIDLTALPVAPAPVPRQPEFTQEQLINLAQCLNEKNVKFFGTDVCPWCVRQKEMFGQAAIYLPYIECNPQTGTEEELALCREYGVRGVPDWRFPDDRQELGMLPLERLAQYSGCPL